MLSFTGKNSSLLHFMKFIQFSFKYFWTDTVHYQTDAECDKYQISISTFLYKLLSNKFLKINWLNELSTMQQVACSIGRRMTKLLQGHSSKVHLHWAKSNAKANFLLWSWSLFNVNNKLDSLWIHLEVMSLSLSRQQKWSLTGTPPFTIKKLVDNIRLSFRRLQYFFFCTKYATVGHAK